MRDFTTGVNPFGALVLVRDPEIGQLVPKCLCVLDLGME
jgi:hypothetical protein